MGIAIKAENLGKQYRLGSKVQREDSLARSLFSAALTPVRNFRKYKSLYSFGKDETSADILWALRDVSFDIREGELVGIIGHNGAGKSTLLKILSRITQPSTGSITIKGRISSLLEVGTGFHPELTGRENVYLNGTILGMRKREVDRKFDEIVQFSEVEKFLDTPVKRYSSGMRVRLAFAVAAHLEPEIMIVDEVLAVGDSTFQKKCIDKMQDVGQRGSTVLFVSHSMPAITRMCERVIMLKSGTVLMDGTAHEVVSAYLQGERDNTAEKVYADGAGPGDEALRLRRVRIITDHGLVTEALDIRRSFAIEVEYDVLEPGSVLMPTFAIWNNEGVNVCVAVDQDQNWRRVPRGKGRYRSRGTIPGNLLSEGMFTVNVTMWTLQPARKMRYHVTDVVAFQIIDTFDGDSARGDWKGDLPGVIRPMLAWQTEFEPEKN